MFDAPVDAWYVWVGLAAVSVAVAGVASDFAARPPPDAADAADTVDAVAASPHPATGEHPLDADAVRLRADRIGLRGEGGTSHASLAFGPVTPVAEGTVLWEVARGAHPSHVFEDPAAFRAAAERARERETTWRPAADRLTVRTVTWEGVRVTLVDA